jgi:hypothetical protein
MGGRYSRNSRLIMCGLSDTQMDALTPRGGCRGAVNRKALDTCGALDLFLAAKSPSSVGKRIRGMTGSKNNIRAALAALKTRGVKWGSDRGGEATAAKARQVAANLLPTIQKLQANGITWLRRIADVTAYSRRFEQGWHSDSGRAQQMAASTGCACPGTGRRGLSTNTWSHCRPDKVCVPVRDCRPVSCHVR